MVHLHVRSWHSHLAGACKPARLVEAAAADGQWALGLMDWQTTAGAVQFSVACRQHGLAPLLGASISVGGAPLGLLATDRESYGNLCDLLTLVHADRDNPGLSWAQLEECAQQERLEGLFCLTGDREGFTAAAVRQRRYDAAYQFVRRLKEVFPDRVFVEQVHHQRPGDSDLVRALDELGATAGVHTVATNAVRHVTRDEYALYDALTCARLGLTVCDPHPERPVNNQAHLCSRRRMEQLPFRKSALANSEVIAHMCSGVNLLAEGINPPHATLPNGLTPDDYMEQLCRAELPRRYKAGSPRYVKAQAVLRRELDIIRGLENAEFFLVVREVMEFARQARIRCSGRGSAANSIVAYLLHITNADPIEHRLLFERFLHAGRKGTPDIDVDFDSSRRDVVIAWMNRRFGETHTAMVANVVTFQLKLATREMMKVLGFPEPSLALASKVLPHFHSQGIREYQGELAAALNIAPDARLLETLCILVTRLHGCPRHLSLHSGGMVLARQPLRYFSPIRTSANGTRQIEFDKDDIDELGIVKLDVLGLRMLSVISEVQDRLEHDCYLALDVDQIPDQDEPTYELIRSGQTLGIFQIESPGQMRLLADTQPQSFRDLVVQVALFRPGPLQGNMVNPYVLRRRGAAPPEYPHPVLENILEDTYGLVIFQEQVLEIVHLFAGLTLVEADDFRRLMSKYRDRDQMEGMRDQFVAGAVRAHTGTEYPVSQELANRVFDIICPFVGYGFCRSHAVAFAHTVYQSAYLKRHFPAAHFCAVLEHHPGFYPAQTLVQEARACGVPLLPVDLRYSDIQYRLEKLPSGDSEENRYGSRVPFRTVKGLAEEEAGELVWQRLQHPFITLEDVYKRVPLHSDGWDALARAGALTCFGPRRAVLWELGLLRRRMSQEGAGQQLLDFALVSPAEVPALPVLEPNTRTAWDFELQSLSAGPHPVAHVRPYLKKLNILSLAELKTCKPGSWVRTAGVVVTRQRPPTAKGFCFLELEDETGLLQVAVPPTIYERFKRILRVPGLVVKGKLEGAGLHRSVLGQRFTPLNQLLERPHTGGYAGHPGQMAH